MQRTPSVPRVLLTAFAFCILLTLSSALFAQETPDPRRTRDKPADDAELNAITERGRAIYAYDFASWHATDAVKALKPKDGLVRMYVARETSAGWQVAFGKLSPAKDAFLIAFETKPGVNPKLPETIIHDPVVEDRGEWLHVARAFETARQTFGGANRAYNMAVLPAKPAGWFVYVYPAQTENNVFPTGADVRYRVSPDGTKIEDTHRMHFSLLEFKREPTTTMFYRTAVMDDAPEDMDVANVLLFGGIPLTIASRNFMYRIEKDGTIQYLGPTKVLLKDDKK